MAVEPEARRRAHQWLEEVYARGGERDAELAGVAGEEGWQVMRFEKLGRRLTIAGTTVAAAAIGGMGTALASRRGPRRRAARLRPGRLTGSRGRRI